MSRADDTTELLDLKKKKGEPRGMVFIHRSTDDEASRPMGAHGLWGKAKDTHETD